MQIEPDDQVLARLAQEICTDAAAFEAWAAQEKRSLWVEAGCDMDRGPEPTDVWCLGYVRQWETGWKAGSCYEAQKAKPVHEPLTEEQIERLISGIFNGKQLMFCPTVEDAVLLARAIEAAHGITATGDAA